MAHRSRLLLLALLVAALCGAGPPAAAAEPAVIVDGFEAPLRTGAADTNGIPIGFFTAQDGGSTAAFSRVAPPAPVPGQAAGNSVLRADLSVQSFGVVIRAFEDGGSAWLTQDWSARAGMAFWFYGNGSGTTIFVDLIDNRNPDSTRDDAERFSTSFADDTPGWSFREIPFDSLARKEIGNGAPNDGLTLSEVHGWAIGALTTQSPQTFFVDDVQIYGVAPPRPLTVGFAGNAFSVGEGATAQVGVRLSRLSAEPVSVRYSVTPGSAVAGRDYTPASGTLTIPAGSISRSFALPTLDDDTYEGDETVVLALDAPSGAELGVAALARVTIQDDERYDALLLDDFERDPALFDSTNALRLSSREIAAGSPLALPGQDAYERVLSAEYGNPSRGAGGVVRRFAAPQDWSAATGLTFWYYGRGSGRPLSVQLLDNQAADPGPAGWKLAWSDEFSAPAGAPADPQTWTSEVGDGTANANPGWGNSELQYYTAGTRNAAHDGAGNLQITVRREEPGSGLRCWYGPCQYTSARLITANKAEFAYGRIEARVKVPSGAGYWPAFWSLGNDIDRVGWPQAGEIDFMEFVGREPYRIFGTIHGPGYSGGASFGDDYIFGQPVPEAYHTYAVEWQPNRIVWYVDGIKYHEATPASVAPNKWVFDHPFFLLLNVAVGGNFGGAVGADTAFPQSMAVDYVRVYQAQDTAERFEAGFTDDFTGWKKLTIPFSAFRRSARQPALAPNDGLTLSAVSGYGVSFLGGLPGPLLLDKVRLKPDCDEAATVSTTADGGPGSLRQALARACDGAPIDFAPALAGQTIELTSAPLTLARAVTVDGSAAPGLTISGGGARRILEVSAGAKATLRSLTLANGFGFELAGAVLTNGDLTLDRVVVRDSRVTTSGDDFWKGGGGIYVGQGAALRLVDSTVRGNSVLAGNGGGIYAFFQSTLSVERSTITGNSANVGGGLRTLGSGQIVNSTISGNAATAWMGGALFHTDGVLELRSSTVTGNTSPAETGGLFVGTFTDASATLRLAGSIVSGNSGQQCFYAPWGAGAVTLASLGGNVMADGSCFAAAGDLVSGAAVVGPLADNGGPTATHALLAGSPAIDAAGTSCPATDQRGVARPQRAACDAGSFEAP